MWRHVSPEPKKTHLAKEKPRTEVITKDHDVTQSLKLEPLTLLESQVSNPISFHVSLSPFRMATKQNLYWKDVLTIVPIVGAGIATIIYLLRLYSRRLAAVGLLLEDILMGIGLLISYCATAFVVQSE